MGVEPVVAFLKRTDSISWPMKMLDKLVDEQTLISESNRMVLNQQKQQLKQQQQNSSVRPSAITPEGYERQNDQGGKDGGYGQRSDQGAHRRHHAIADQSDGHRILGQVPCAVRIDRDPGAHGGREADLPQVPALGGSRLGPQDLV